MMVFSGGGGLGETEVSWIFYLTVEPLPLSGTPGVQGCAVRRRECWVGARFSLACYWDL